jgi:hypothetical protein
MPHPNSDSKALGDQIELFPGQTASELGHDKTRAAFNRQRWFKVLHSSQQTAEFLSSLSLSQLSSHELLREWLAARSEDDKFNSEANLAECSLEVERKPQFQVSPSGLHSYHYRLAKLLLFEFSYPDEGTPTELHRAELQQVRRDAALYASCQRLAKRCYEAAELPFSERELHHIQERCRPPYGASVDPCFWIAFLPLGCQREADERGQENN